MGSTTFNKPLYDEVAALNGKLTAVSNNLAKKTFYPTERTTVTIPSGGYQVPNDGWYRFTLDGSNGAVGFDVNDLPTLYVDSGHKLNSVLCLRKNAKITKNGTGTGALQFMGTAE